MLSDAFWIFTTNRSLLPSPYLLPRTVSVRSSQGALVRLALCFYPFVSLPSFPSVCLSLVCLLHLYGGARHMALALDMDMDMNMDMDGPCFIGDRLDDCPP